MLDVTGTESALRAESSSDATLRARRRWNTVRVLAPLLCALHCNGGAPRSQPAPRTSSVRSPEEPTRSSGHPSAALQEQRRATPVPAPARGPQPTPPSQADRHARLLIGASTLSVDFDHGAYTIGDAQLLAWIERAARAVEAYYGAFPVPSLLIRLRAVPGRGLRGGRVLPTRDTTIVMDVGVASAPAHFERNWSMTHEMVHLALPNVPRAHHWLEEGLASYVEPIARARTGWLPEEAVWREWLENLPLGVPAGSGLDETSSWANTYWGGALFCFLADLEIRKASGNRRELADALRAILGAGGNITRHWPLERVLRVGDEATGTTVLQDLYDAMKASPEHVDLPAIFRDLGVRLEGGRVRYDDAAPLAAIRRSMVVEKP